MTRTISANLKAHYAEQVRTIARCWQITRTDSTVLRFTNHDKNLTIGGQVYYALNSGRSSDIEAGDNLGVRTIDVEAVLNSSYVSAADILAGRYDGATVWIFEVNYESIGDSFVTLSYGYIGEVEVHDDYARCEFRSLSQKLTENIGRIYTYQCDAAFGDSRCGLDLDSLGYKESGTVASVTNRSLFGTSSAGGSEYARGRVVWTSGLNNGLAMQIKTFSGSSMQLILPMPFNVQASDGYTAYYGCAKTRSACIAYNNIVNYRGFPDMPGIMEATQTPDAR